LRRFDSPSVRLSLVVDHSADNLQRVKALSKRTSSHFLSNEAHEFLRKNREAFEMLVHEMYRDDIKMEFK